MRLRYEKSINARRKKEWKISATVLSVLYNARAMYMHTYECIVYPKSI